MAKAGYAPARRQVDISPPLLVPDIDVLSQFYRYGHFFKEWRRVVIFDKKCTFLHRNGLFSRFVIPYFEYCHPIVVCSDKNTIVNRSLLFINHAKRIDTQFFLSFLACDDVDGAYDDDESRDDRGQCEALIG